MSFSKIQVLGNIGNDAIINEIKKKFVISFSIAVNTKNVDKDGVQTETVVWWHCSYWRQSKEKCNLAQYIRKGDPIYIEGIPVINIFEDKQGTTLLRLNVFISTIELIGTAKK